MRIKATIVAYAFSVQCFENATIVAYAGLRVKYLTKESFLLLCKSLIWLHLVDTWHFQRQLISKYQSIMYYKQLHSLPQLELVSKQHDCKIISITNNQIMSLPKM